MTVLLFAQDIVSIDSYQYLDKVPQLTNFWKFSVTDSPSFADIDCDDSGWQTGIPGTRFPVEYKDRATDPSGRRAFWTRTRFRVSGKLKGTSILLSPDIADPYEIFLNGIKIYPHDVMSMKEAFSEREMPIVIIHDRQIFYGTHNVLAVRIHAAPTGVITLPDILVFRANGLMYHPGIPSFINAETFSTICLLFFVIFVTLAVFQRKEVENLIFAIANLFFSYYFHRMIVPPNLLPYIASYNVSKAFLLVAVVLDVIFIRYYFKKPFGKLTLFILGIITLILSLIMVSFPRSINEADMIFTYLILGPSFIGVIGVGWFSYIAMREKQSSALIVFIGAALAVGAGVHDIVIMFMGDLARLWLQGIGLVSFNFSIFIALITHIMKIYKDLENYTAKVELAVRNRTMDLGKANTDLEKALADAREANRAKDDFLANVSHEIRTPLNCIVGFAEIVSEHAKESAVGEYANLVVQESEKLQHLINEILDIAKIESGRIEIVKETFSITEVVRSVYRNFYAAVTQKGLAFSYSVQDSVPDFLSGDSFRIRQVLMNLTSNAVKFTHSGVIDIRVLLLEMNDNKAVIRFEVEDTGIGIKTDSKVNIFDSFVQQDSSTVRKYGGTGLGTAISKKLVDMMEGEIGYSSREGKGSVFFFTIAFDCGQYTDIMADNRASSGFPGLSGMRVLLAEDYLPNRQLVESLLGDMELVWDIAVNGIQAFDRYQSAEYDLVLMDVQMPEMDGCEATRRIREYEVSGKRKHVPIIGFTANAFPRDIKRYLAAGMDDVITKPVRRREFFQKIGGILQGSGNIEVSASRVLDKNTVFDYQALLDEVEHDYQGVRNLVRGFLGSLDEYMAEILVKLESGSYREAHRDIHSLRGGASNLFGNHLAGKAHLLENYLKDLAVSDNEGQRTIDDWKPLYDGLVEAVAEFRSAVLQTVGPGY